MSQSAFRAALLDPDRPAPPGLTDPDGRPAGRRFDVYRNNVTVSLTEALRQCFPVVRKLVGDDFFTAMAREHLRAHPPTSPILMFYGAAMPDFLANFPPVAHLGYLPDIGRLELALRHAYHAADATPVAADALGALAPEMFLATRIRLAPALHLIRSDWPIHAIWHANMSGGAAPKQRRAEDVLILRPAFDPMPHLLPEGAASFIETLSRGGTVGAAIEATPTLDLTATLSLLISGGAIAGLDPDPASC
jgi:hypothetical protein